MKERGRKKEFYIYKLSVVYNEKKLVATKHEKCLTYDCHCYWSQCMISLLSDPSPPWKIPSSE